MEDVHAHLAGAYDRAAPAYERAGVAHHAPFSERLAQLVLLGPGGRVLDVGCGAGGALLPAARRVGPTGEALGIDIAPGMVERTRAAAEEAGLGQVRAEVMDGAALDGFEDEHFDAVLAAFTLAAIPNAERALTEWRRVLRPTGMLGVAMWTNLVDDAWAWESELNNEFAAEIPPELLETAGSLFGRFREAPELRDALERAGFSDVTVETKHADLTFESAESWWEWTWAGGFRAFLEAMSEDAQERYREAAFARLAAAGRDDLTQRFVAMLARARP